MEYINKRVELILMIVMNLMLKVIEKENVDVSVEVREYNENGVYKCERRGVNRNPWGV